MAAAIITEEFNLRELQKALAAVEVQPASREHGAHGVCAARCMPRTSPRARAVVRSRVLETVRRESARGELRRTVMRW